MSKKFNLTLLSLAIALAGCGKKEGATTSAVSPEVQATAGQERIAKDAAGRDIYKDADGGIRVSRVPLLPLDQYVHINIDQDFRANGDAEIAKVSGLYRTAYWASAKLDYDALGQDFVPSAWTEKDAFKLADIAKQNKAALDDAYAQARKNQHFALYSGASGGVSVSKYDSVKKGFPVNFTVDEKETIIWEEKCEGAPNSRYWNLGRLGATAETDQYYMPASEEEARRIESVLSPKRDQWGATALPAYYLTHAAAASSSQSSGHATAYLITDGVIVVDPNSKTPLFTIDMATVSPKPKVYNNKIREALVGDKAG